MPVCDESWNVPPGVPTADVFMGVGLWVPLLPSASCEVRCEAHCSCAWCVGHIARRKHGTRHCRGCCQPLRACVVCGRAVWLAVPCSSWDVRECALARPFALAQPTRELAGSAYHGVDGNRAMRAVAGGGVCEHSSCGCVGKVPWLTGCVSDFMKRKHSGMGAAVDGCTLRDRGGLAPAEHKAQLPIFVCT